MNLLRQLGFLKINLRAEKGTDEEHRVLALFRNRAELKKAYGGLQEETYRLKDLIKQQEAATQRAQEMLSALEGRLSVADTAYSALVFYQLRRLWQTGRELIGEFVADLARQQDERERRSHLALHNQRQFARRQACEQQLQAAQEQSDAATAAVAALEQERAGLKRFWHYFRRRSLDKRIAAEQAATAAAGAALGQAQAALEAVSQEPLSEFTGLSLGARRAINLAAIAYAEVLCVRLQVIPLPLLTLAREATAQRAPTDSYGTPKECVLMMAQIQRAQRLIGSRNSLSEEIRARSERLKAAARYRGAADTCPINDSIEPEAEEAAPPARGAAPLPNVLAEDTWDMFRVLLR
jgi:hypothetical protein